MRFALLLITVAAMGGLAGLGLSRSDLVVGSVQSFRMYASACFNAMAFGVVAFVGYAVTL